MLDAFLGARDHRISKATFVRYNRGLQVFLRFLVQHLGHDKPEMAEISRPVIDAYHDWLFDPRNSLHGDKVDDEGKTRGKARSKNTVRKMVEVVHLWWEWAEESDRWPGQIPRPRRVELAKDVPQEPVAATFAEAQAAIAAAGAWYKHLFTWLYYTGLRLGESMLATWSDVDMQQGTFLLRAETTKKGGRLLPLHPALLDEIATWGTREGYVIKAPDTRPRERQATPEKLRDVWARAGVREVVWRGRPAHAFRKAFKSGLIALGADRDAVDWLQGHELAGGARGKYIDAWLSLPLRETIAMVPVLGSLPPGNVHALPARKG